jgi:hypothetical protein
MNQRVLQVGGGALIVVEPGSRNSEFAFEQKRIVQPTRVETKLPKNTKRRRRKPEGLFPRLVESGLAAFGRLSK